MTIAKVFKTEGGWYNEPCAHRILKVEEPEYLRIYKDLKSDARRLVLSGWVMGQLKIMSDEDEERRYWEILDLIGDQLRDGLGFKPDPEEHNPTRDFSLAALEFLLDQPEACALAQCNIHYDHGKLDELSEEMYDWVDHKKEFAETLDWISAQN